MHLRLWAAITIFLGSYLPLSIILLAQDFKYKYLKYDFCFDFWAEQSTCSLPFQNPYASLPIFFVCLFCFLITIITLSVIKLNNSSKIISSKYIPSELMNYTLPYVVSFMGMGADYGEASPDKFIGIFIFMIWIFWITYKSGQIILNPVLVAFGWKLHEITYSFAGSSSQHTTTALIKGPIKVGDAVQHNWIQEVMIAKKKQ